jgi:hypothetical protein
MRPNTADERDADLLARYRANVRAFLLLVDSGAHIDAVNDRHESPIGMLREHHAALAQTDALAAQQLNAAANQQPQPNVAANQQLNGVANQQPNAAANQQSNAVVNQQSNTAHQQPNAPANQHSNAVVNQGSNVVVNQPSNSVANGNAQSNPATSQQSGSQRVICTNQTGSNKQDGHNLNRKTPSSFVGGLFERETLLCLAARVIRRNGIMYAHRVPADLISFVDAH